MTPWPAEEWQILQFAAGPPCGDPAGGFSVVIQLLLGGVHQSPSPSVDSLTVSLANIMPPVTKLSPAQDDGAPWKLNAASSEQQRAGRPVLAESQH